MKYPKNVKDIKNLNEFIREARKLETDTYWANILYDCSSANYADWTRKESRLKWKREMIQKYLNYKNKIEESYNFDDYTKRVEEFCNKELNDFITLLQNNFPKCTVSKPIKSKRGEYRLQLRHKDLIITIMLMELLTTESGKPEYAISYDGHQKYIGSKEDVINFINKYLKDDYKLEEKASLDWNNYLTTDEIINIIGKKNKYQAALDLFKDKNSNFYKHNYKNLKKLYTDEDMANDIVNYNRFEHFTESLGNMLTLYHNTTNDNAIKINKEGIIPGLRKDVYGKGSEGEATGIWCSTERGYGYGGATVTFRVSADDKNLVKENDTEYMLYRNVAPNEIVDIDLMISNIPSNPNRKDSINSTVESDIPYAVKYWGKKDVLKILGKENHLAKPYTKEQLQHLLDTGEKYCKGEFILKENKDDLKRHEIFNYIKTFNPNADWNNYKDKSINQILAIWQSYQNRANRKKSDIENKIDEIDKEEYIEIPETTLDIDYDYETDESIASRLDLEKGLEYEKELNENKVKGIPSKYQFMVKDLYKGGDGYWNIDLEDGFENNDGTNYIWDKTKKGCLEILDSLYQDYKKSNKVTESIHKLEEKSRNELLAKTKSQTVTRYNKAEGYKGFYIYDIDTTNIFNKNSNLLITCKVGDYHSQVEIENTLWWVEYEVDERGHDTQITTKYVTQALMDAIDGMNIKVNCECGDFVYRMKYQATKYGYNYGRPENRPAKITNPNDIGALCKHLTAMLSNKKWLQQVTSTLMDYIVKNIDKVNQFLNRKPGQELTVPNEAQRRLGKQAAYSKVLSRQEVLQNAADDFIKEVGDKIFTQNINLDDDLRRFINNSDDYSWQKIQPNEFRVIKGYIDNYIKNNSKDVNN